MSDTSCPPFDYTACFPHHILIYKCYGFWKPPNNMRHKYLYNIYKNVCLTIWILFLISQVVYMGINRNDINEFTATLFVTITFSVILIKMLVLYGEMDRIQSFIRNLNRPLFQIKNWRQYNIADNAKRFSLWYFYLCVFFGGSTDVFWCLAPFLGRTRITYEKGWYPFDWEVSPHYEIFYAFQGFACIMNTFLCLNQDSFYATLATQVSVQCELLCDTLKNLDSFRAKDGRLFEIEDYNKKAKRFDREMFSTEMTKNLLVCITHHKEILGIAKDIIEIHYKSVYIMFLGGAFILCCCFYQIYNVQFGSIAFFSLFFYLGSMLTEQFTYCWFGNEVIFQSAKIIDAIFNTPWIDCNSNYRKIALQFMTNTTKPIIMKAGLLEISIGTYLMVLRTAYSYFALLKKIGDDHHGPR